MRSFAYLNLPSLIISFSLLMRSLSYLYLSPLLFISVCLFIRLFSYLYLSPLSITTFLSVSLFIRLFSYLYLSPLLYFSLFPYLSDHSLNSLCLHYYSYLCFPIYQIILLSLSVSNTIFLSISLFIRSLSWLYLSPLLNSSLFPYL